MTPLIRFIRRDTVVHAALLSIALSTTTALCAPSDQTQIPTTRRDFFLPGTQVSDTDPTFSPILSATTCANCHAGYSATVAPYDTWIGSMMANAARDPIWIASRRVALQDADTSGEFCTRCHAPGAWLMGSGHDPVLPPNAIDREGVNCHFCHRMVNPTEGAMSGQGYPENTTPNPTPDVPILSRLAAEGNLPSAFLGNASYVVDPNDVRRGPFDDVPSVPLYGADGLPVGPYHNSTNVPNSSKLIFSPYHSDGAFCGTCHDVSNPAFSAEPDGTFALNRLDEPHPTMNKGDMFNEQRTFSEWLNSTFASEGVYFEDRRFGGNHPTGIMKSCQDCHMPDQIGAGCKPYSNAGVNQRPNVPQHSFAGANTWVVRAVATTLGPVGAAAIGLTPEIVDAAIARNVQMLRDASDMELTQVGSQLSVKIINQSGHKLPTGFPEGRRAWINVKFFDDNGDLLAERGNYDLKSATLTQGDTKVYEAEQVIGPDVAAATGLPNGAHFHVALNNVILLDNRIPPRGFTNAAFAAAGAAPVNYMYEDGQYWDITEYEIPEGAASTAVTFYFQTSSREFMEFLRDATLTPQGQDAYDLWVLHGKSAPVAMDAAELDFVVGNPADLNGDGLVNNADLAILLENWGGRGIGDINLDGIVNGVDLALMLGSWTK